MPRFATPAQGTFQGLASAYQFYKNGLHIPTQEGVEGFDGLDGITPSLGLRRSRLNGARGLDSFDFRNPARDYYLNPMVAGGGQQCRRIIGTSRDKDGNTLANCIIQGFVTADDLYVGQVTSDNAGYFELPTLFTSAHYIVAYKAGSPDLAGTTVNTLVGV